MSGFLYRLGHRCARHPLRVLGVWLLIAVAFVRAQAAHRRRLPGRLHRPRRRVPGGAPTLLKEQFPDRPASPAASCSTSTTAASTTRPTGAPSPTPSTSSPKATTSPASPTRSTRAAPPSAPTARPRSSTVQYDEADASRPTHFDEADEAVDAGRDAGRADRDLRRRSPTPARRSRATRASASSSPSIVLLVAFGSVDRRRASRSAPPCSASPSAWPASASSPASPTCPTTSPMLAMMIGLGVGIDYALFVVTRHRQHLHEGMRVADAAGQANATAGQAVLFAGTTVVIAIVGLLRRRHPGRHDDGLRLGDRRARRDGSSPSRCCPRSSASPGTRIDRLAIHRAARRSTRRTRPSSGRWAAPRRPPARGATRSSASSPSLALAAARARPAHRLRRRRQRGRRSTTQRQAYDLLADGFGPGFNGPLQIVVDAPTRPRRDDVAACPRRRRRRRRASRRSAPAVAQRGRRHRRLQRHPDHRPRRTRRPRSWSTACATTCCPTAVDGTGPTRYVTGSDRGLRGRLRRASASGSRCSSPRSCCCRSCC